MGTYLRKNEKGALEALLRVLKHEGVALHPTDTVYGLGACAFSQRALRRIFLLKGRSPKNPLLVLADSEKLRSLVSFIPSSLKNMWNEYLRFPITAILPAKHPWPFITKEGKIAVRIPAEPFLQQALKNLPCPIASTSANPSGKILSPARAFTYFANKVELVILAEETFPLPSTIVDFTGAFPEIIRGGAYLPRFL